MSSKADRSEFDGCSGFISFLYFIFTGGPPPCEDCCFEHDAEYQRGGPLRKKFLADVRFYLCERQCHGRLVCALLFLGVTFGGLPWLPFPSVKRDGKRWRFAWTGVRWGWPKRFPAYRDGSYIVALLEFAAFLAAVAALAYFLFIR